MAAFVVFLYDMIITFPEYVVANLSLKRKLIAFAYLPARYVSVDRGVEEDSDEKHVQLELVWKAKWSSGKILFLANRYPVFLVSTFLLFCASLLVIRYASAPPNREVLS